MMSSNDSSDADHSISAEQPLLLDITDVKSQLHSVPFKCIGHTPRFLRCNKSIGRDARRDAQSILAKYNGEIPPENVMHCFIRKLLCIYHRSEFEHVYLDEWAEHCLSEHFSESYSDERSTAEESVGDEASALEASGSEAPESEASDSEAPYSEASGSEATVSEESESETAESEEETNLACTQADRNRAVSAPPDLEIEFSFAKSGSPDVQKRKVPTRFPSDDQVAPQNLKPRLHVSIDFAFCLEPERISQSTAAHRSLRKISYGSRFRRSCSSRRKKVSSSLASSFERLNISEPESSDDISNSQQGRRRDRQHSSQSSSRVLAAGFHLLGSKSGCYEYLTGDAIRELEADFIDKRLSSRQKLRPQRYIYVFTAAELPGLVKVGIADNVYDRRKAIERLCHIEVVPEKMICLKRASLVEDVVHRILTAWGCNVRIKCHWENGVVHKECFRCDTNVAVDLVRIWSQIDGYYTDLGHPKQWWATALDEFKFHGGPKGRRETLENMMDRHDTGISELSE